MWGPRAAKLRNITAKSFAGLVWLYFALAVGYAINWGTAEGGHVQSVDQVRAMRSVQSVDQVSMGGWGADAGCRT